VLDEFWTDLTQMLVAGAIVAAFSLPAGLVAWTVVRRSGNPLLPRWQPWRAPWGCFELVVAFLVVNIIPAMIALGLAKLGDSSGVPSLLLPPVEATAAVLGMPAAIGTQEQAVTAAMIRGLAAGVFAFPLQLSILLGASRILYPTWWSAARPALAAQVVLAVITWAILTPLTLGFNAVVNLLFTSLNWSASAHPLTKLAGRSSLDSALLVIQACVVAPVLEEILFRGVILAWAMGGRKPHPVPDVPSKIRPWLVALAGVLFAATSGWYGAIGFSLILIAGQAVVVYLFRAKRRAVGAIYSSAALFALVHSQVWPSPIPLFLLGLGLGWLAVRTRGILVPAFVHGLFNAVSAVIVLRSTG
jgi:membrane protease YdiL (CAAX protease family)